MRLYVLLEQDTLQASKPPEENGSSLLHQSCKSGRAFGVGPGSGRVWGRFQA